MRLILITLVSFVLWPAYGWEPYQADVTQQDFAASTQKLDHLLPVNGKSEESYYVIRYDAHSSFEDSTHLIISREESSGKYFLETCKTKTTDRNHSPSTPFAETKKEIPQALANLALQMWVNCLLEVRYDRKSSNGLDGTTYEFSTFIRGIGWLHGEAWSPGQDLPPKWMVDAGRCLLKLSKDDAYKVETCTEDLTKLRSKLFDYLEDHGKN